MRIILGKTEPGDGEEQNVYTRAAANLQHWRAEQVLVRDAEPSIYLYTQTFRFPATPREPNWSVAASSPPASLRNTTRKVVFRHEQTLSKPKADRLNLLRATQAHFGQIFMLYSDPARAD